MRLTGEERHIGAMTSLFSSRFLFSRLLAMSHIFRYLVPKYVLPHYIFSHYLSSSQLLFHLYGCYSRPGSQKARSKYQRKYLRALKEENFFYLFIIRRAISIYYFI